MRHQLENFLFRNRRSAVLIGLFSVFINSSIFAQTKALFSPEGGVREAIISELESSRCSVDAALYSFSDAGIWSALEGAAKRGVTVRLILNRSAFTSVSGSSQKLCKSCGDLIERGGSVRFHPKTMHHKFAVIDAGCSAGKVLTGSGNWSTSSNSRYDEDFLLYDGNGLNHESAVVAFNSEFDFVWNYSVIYPSLEQNPVVGRSVERVEGFYFTTQNMTPRKHQGRWNFSAKKGDKTGVSGRVIIEHINSAASSVKIATAHFRRSDIYAALVAASKRGVKVSLITDGQEFNRVSSEDCGENVSDDKFLDECLSMNKHGDVSYKFYSIVWNYKTAQQMHSKYMIIDDDVVLTGSFNWSFTAEFKNLENMVRLDEPKLVAGYVENFEKISSYGKGSVESVKDQLKDSGGKGPCNFEPMTISGKEINAIRSLSKRGYCR